MSLADYLNRYANDETWYDGPVQVGKRRELTGAGEWADVSEAPDVRYRILWILLYLCNTSLTISMQ
jgi:hypothetical protein